MPPAPRGAPVLATCPRCASVATYAPALGAPKSKLELIVASLSREAVRTAGGLGLPSARATFANSLERRSSLFGALEHVWHQEALILTTLTRQGRCALC